jgi:hypothetical protein
MKNNWNDFVELYDWEFNLINHPQKEDVRMWIKLCLENGANALELGAGTGRITRFLASHGIKITALDNASEFVYRLNQMNPYPNLHAYVGDMRTIELNERFPFCFLGYSTFQYLLTLEDQLSCLRGIGGVLIPHGKVAFDLDPDVCNIPENRKRVLLYKEFFPPGNCYLSMYTSNIIDYINSVTTWSDEYIFHDGQGRKFTHNLSLKGVTLESMQNILENTGFHIEAVYGDFEFHPYANGSDRLIIIAEKR